MINIRRILRRSIFPFALLGLWAATARLGLVKPWILPAPSEVARSFWDGLTDQLGPRWCPSSLVFGVLVSLKRLFVGYSISLAGGVALGLALARSRIVRDMLGAPVAGMQALPSICWLPLAMIWFGLSEAAILFVVIAGSLLSIAIATEDGVRNIAPLYVRAARTMGASGFTLYSRVVLPAALPGIITGMKLGWTFAWRSLMAGELIYVAGGIGQLLKTGQDTNDMSRVLAVIGVIMALGLLIEGLLFSRLENAVRERWGYDRA